MLYACFMAKINVNFHRKASSYSLCCTAMIFSKIVGLDFT